MKDQYEFVKGVLEKYPDTRDDDMKLFARVCYLKDNPLPANVSFYNAVFKHFEYNLPSYEAITRTRRKVQQNEPALRGEKYKNRQDRERDYRDYYSPI